MIQHLYIKDFAIIDEVNLDMKPGFTVITGETGSGKSIILEALSVSLGAKADKLMVRFGADRAVIETDFNQTSYRRLISNKGRTKAFQNDEPITVTNLKKSNETTVDFHGQHDQQLILNTDRHIDYLDHFCGHKDDVNKLGQTYQELTSYQTKLYRIRQTENERRDRLDLLKFQAQEIDSVNPILDEDLKLDKDFKKMSHLEDIIKTLQLVQNQVNTGDNSVIDILENNFRSIESLSQYDEDLKQISEMYQTAIIQLQEAGTDISMQLSGSEFDAEILSEISERLQALESLKRKYGGSIEAVLNNRESIHLEIKSLTKPELSEDEILKQIKFKQNKFSILAKRLHQSRLKNAKILSAKVENAMSLLNMPGAVFKINISMKKSDSGFFVINGENVEANSQGIDWVQFFLSANPGEPVKPLASIASGGEISRIMLAIKTVFQDLDPVQTLIFDEIDSGISGIAAEKVADQLLKLSKSKQVICITHLSQIAQKADYHLHITKIVENDQTFVKVNYLNEIESSRIISELFVGTKETSA